MGCRLRPVARSPCPRDSDFGHWGTESEEFDHGLFDEIDQPRNRAAAGGDFEASPSVWFWLLGADGFGHVEEVISARRVNPDVDGDVALGQELSAALCPDEFEVDPIWSLHWLGNLFGGFDPRYPALRS